ncbi:hypothetical protein TNCV_4664011 [Trichonephila clavipes]|nr:hypothetical protein TNCV_4664011 [Trichonephila clavipes]
MSPLEAPWSPVQGLDKLNFGCSSESQVSENRGASVFARGDLFCLRYYRADSLPRPLNSFDWSGVGADLPHTRSMTFLSAGKSSGRFPIVYGSIELCGRENYAPKSSFYRGGERQTFLPQKFRFL